MRMAHSGKGSQHVFQSPQMAGMIQGVGLRCLMTVLRDFQDGQDRSVLTDAAAMNLAGQPFHDGLTARLAGSDLAPRSGKSGYSLRT